MGKSSIARCVISLVALVLWPQPWLASALVFAGQTILSGLADVLIGALEHRLTQPSPAPTWSAGFGKSGTRVWNRRLLFRLPQVVGYPWYRTCGGLRFRDWETIVFNTVWHKEPHQAGIDTVCLECGMKMIRERDCHENCPDNYFTRH
jgi:hypothetical protein